jgi:hypothetical protein
MELNLKLTPFIIPRRYEPWVGTYFWTAVFVISFRRHCVAPSKLGISFLFDSLSKL